MRALPPFVAVFFAAVSAAHCGRDPDAGLVGDEGSRYAETVCEAIDSCGCIQRFDSRGACETEFSERLDRLLDDGLHLSHDCFERVLGNASIFDECVGFDGWPDDVPCDALRGDRALLEPCTRHAELPGLFVDECAEGLRCEKGQCLLTGKSRLAGDPCEVDDPTSCLPEPLYCAPDGTCRPPVELGQSCDAPLSCAHEQDEAPIENGAYCAGLVADGSGICTQRIVPGEPCDPLDYNACALPGAGHRGWCDPTTRTCADGPGICIALDYPTTWPDGWP